MKEGWLWLSILKTTASPSPISTTPAFSPGPQMTRGPSVGSVLSQTFDDLYEQCSLHIAEKTPSSVRFGVRPRMLSARANSSADKPFSAARAGVTLLLFSVIPGSPAGRDPEPMNTDLSKFALQPDHNIAGVRVHGFRVRVFDAPRNDI